MSPTNSFWIALAPELHVQPQRSSLFPFLSFSVRYTVAATHHTMKFPSILTQLKVLVTTAATLACSIPHLYEKIVAKLSSTETAVTPKYMYVGHARVFFAQGVRKMFSPLGSRTTRWILRVLRNLCSVRAVRTRTAIEMKRARVRDMTRNFRIRILRS